MRRNQSAWAIVF